MPVHHNTMMHRHHVEQVHVTGNAALWSLDRQMQAMCQQYCQNNKLAQNCCAAVPNTSQDRQLVSSMHQQFRAIYPKLPAGLAWHC